VALICALSLIVLLWAAADVLRLLRTKWSCLAEQAGRHAPARVALTTAVTSTRARPAEGAWTRSDASPECVAAGADPGVTLKARARRRASPFAARPPSPVQVRYRRAPIGPDTQWHPTARNGSSRRRRPQKTWPEAVHQQLLMPSLAGMASVRRAAGHDRAGGGQTRAYRRADGRAGQWPTESCWSGAEAAALSQGSRSHAGQDSIRAVQWK
jgi:hypothetical protein